MDKSSRSDVLFVAMPFASVNSPSLGLALLRAALDRDSIASQVQYFLLDFARRIGRTHYERVARMPAQSLAAEWVFSRAAFGSSPSLEEFCAVGPGTYDQTIRDSLSRARQAAEQFIDDCAAHVLAAEPTIVGFTSVFQQHVASLALARRLKVLRPTLLTLIGGSNCEGEMGRELKRVAPYIDGVVSGEADGTISRIVRETLEKKSLPSDVPGLFTDANVDDMSHPETCPVENMDSLPFAKYDDFVPKYYELFGNTEKPLILLETARGCWWGQKHHCTFCGLNDSTIAFRSKSASRALAEVEYLESTYPGHCIYVVDNILDMRYFSNFIPELARRNVSGREMFYETKANLRKEHLRMLRDAGILQLQPGIESLSTAVLSIMRKGISMLQNVQFLKWCKEFGILPLWNMLWEFPGERPDSYENVAKLIPLVTHLQPPESSVRIRLDRFSPNYDQAAQLGFSNVRPFPGYSQVYPFSEDSLSRLAYFFMHDHADGRTDFSYLDATRAAVEQWNNEEGLSDLFCVAAGPTLLVFDSRACALEPVVALRGSRRLIYTYCDAIRGRADIRRHAENAGISSVDTEATIEDLITRRLMIEEEGRYLALAIAAGEYNPTSPITRKQQRRQPSAVKRAFQLGWQVSSRLAALLERYRERRILK